ncbi:MAG TPA: SAF domain-containing protein [Candidatus Dormibacteraeota bacterium]|nr:SAF domain-containing protein [Candidatus Dormibacteraeota bacterium]
MLKRWLVASVALGLGVAVSVALLVFANPSRDAVEVYVAAADIPAGTALAGGSVALARVNVNIAHQLLFVRTDGAALAALRASHDLAAGQLIQRSDAVASDTPADRRLVFVPLQNVPGAPPGSRVDLLVLDGGPDHLTVEPFALGVEVRSSSPAGLVLVVAAERAAAFVYAGSVMHLAAVIAEPGSAGGTESSVSTTTQAIQVAEAP